MADKELKPCPCCGSVAEIKNTPQSDFIQRDVRYWVRCNKRCIEQFETYETPRQAQEAWNHRQPDTELVEALEGMVKSYDRVWINYHWYTGDHELLPSQVASSIIKAEEALAKYKEKE